MLLKLRFKKKIYINLTVNNGRVKNMKAIMTYRRTINIK